MIVCHCNVISCGDFRRAYSDLREERADGAISVSCLFKACGRSPNCCNCFRSVHGLMKEARQSEQLAVAAE